MVFHVLSKAPILSGSWFFITNTVGHCDVMGRILNHLEQGRTPEISLFSLKFFLHVRLLTVPNSGPFSPPFKTQLQDKTTQKFTFLFTLVSVCPHKPTFSARKGVLHFHNCISPHPRSPHLPPTPLAKPNQLILPAWQRSMITK
jgi:hypothetical protein